MFTYKMSYADNIKILSPSNNGWAVTRMNQNIRVSLWPIVKKLRLALDSSDIAYILLTDQSVLEGWAINMLE